MIVYNKNYFHKFEPVIKKIGIAILLVMIAGKIGNNAVAQSVSRVGTSAANFLKIGVGAKALGMGEAFATQANDVSAIYWNPSGLSSVQNVQVILNHYDYIADIYFDYGAVAIPLGSAGVIGLHFAYLGMPDIERTTNGWGSSQNISNNIPGGANGAWVTPYIIDPVDNQTLYIGYVDLWKTTNRGNSFTKIGDFSGDKLKSLAICQSDPDVIVAGTNYILYKTTDGGATWTTVTSNLPTPITYVTIKDSDPNTIWATISNYSGQNVYKTTDGGTNWTNISAGLPSIPANTIVQNTLNSEEEELYVGTDAGVYMKLGTEDWTAFSTGFPNVVVDELEIYYDADNNLDSKLRAATFGRGLWESDLYSNSDILIATIFATPGCDTGTITVNSNMDGLQTFYLTDADGLELDSAEVEASSYDFEGIQDGNYKGKLKKDEVYSELTGPVELINSELPAQPDDITGEPIVCLGEESLVYEVNEMEGADIYNWVLPVGVEIVSGEGTNSIEVNITMDAVSGPITVQAENICGAGEFSNEFQVVVITIPDAAGEISGPEMINSGDEVFDYMIDEVDGAESYSWLLDPSWTLVDGDGTNHIQIMFGSDAADGTLSVSAGNMCGLGEESSLAIDVVHVGIQEIEQSAIKLFPNPTKGILNVELSKELTSDIHVKVINLLGENVLQLENVSQNQFKLDISQFTPGIYLVHIQAGNQILTKRIILDK